MPVNVGRLGQAIREAYLEHVADARLDRGPGDLAVVAPALHARTGTERPVDFAGFEVYGDDGSTGVRLRRVVRRAVGVERVGGRLVFDRTMSVRMMRWMRVML